MYSITKFTNILNLLNILNILIHTNILQDQKWVEVEVVVVVVVVTPLQDQKWVPPTRQGPSQLAARRGPGPI